MNLPDRLGLLPAATVTKHLTLGVRAGREQPPYAALLRAAKPADLLISEAVELEAIRSLLDEAMSRFADQRTGADAWLAPRLHATLRLTRAEASDPELWNFLALLVGLDYVVWRHLGKGKDGAPDNAPEARFSGAHYTQAFARLWWAAELFRDGDDYGPVELACQEQAMLNSALRLEIIDHRPTAQALIGVLRNLVDSGAGARTRRVEALLKAVNTAGSTLVYDVLAPDAERDVPALLAWIMDAASAPVVSFTRLPVGPEDGRTDPSAVDTLVPLFEKFLAEAPVRSSGNPTRPGANPAPEDAEQGVDLPKGYTA
jgi:hypothetical protein